MLSPLLQKLLFVKQFSMGSGKIDLLGSSYTMLDSSSLLALQNVDKTKMYSIAKSSTKAQVKSIVDHAQVYKGIKDESLRNIAELGKKVGNSDQGMIKTIQDIFDLCGLGKLEISDLNNKDKEATLKVHDSSLALAHVAKYKTKAKACAITAGTLAGVFTYLFDKNVECTEVKCKAEGQDFCVFEIG